MPAGQTKEYQPTLIFDDDGYSCARCGGSQTVLCQHWKALFERAYAAIDLAAALPASGATNDLRAARDLLHEALSCPCKWCSSCIDRVHEALEKVAAALAAASGAAQPLHITVEQLEKVHEIIEQHSSDVIDYETAADDVSDYLFGGVRYGGVLRASGAAGPTQTRCDYIFAHTNNRCIRYKHNDDDHWWSGELERKLTGAETPAAPASEQGVETLAAKFHEIYQQEAKRQGDVRHKDAYGDLPENIKEFDRVLARYVLAARALPSDALRELKELSEKATGGPWQQISPDIRCSVTIQAKDYRFAVACVSYVRSQLASAPGNEKGQP